MDPENSTPWTEAMDGSPCEVDLNSGAGDRPGDRAREIADYGFIRFQCGPVAEAGVNGTTIEAVIDVLKERLLGFQRGPFACSENQAAIEHLAEAGHVLRMRTQARQAQGVEGTNAPHEGFT